MTIRIGRLGPFAERFLMRHATARVSAVFARSFHLESGADALCVVDPQLGDGALNAVLANAFEPSPKLRVDARAIIGAQNFAMDGLAFAFGGAEGWTPSSTPWSNASAATLVHLMEAALARAPDDGCFRATLDSFFQPDSILERALRDRAQALIGWLRTARSDEAPPVGGLIGLGSGLTPAGDDFVGGAMIALRWRGEDARVALLSQAVEALGGSATTVLSGAMLRAAAEGFGGAALHDMLDAIGAGDAARGVYLLDAIDRIGHTSGWDALAGAIAALRL